MKKEGNRTVEAGVSYIDVKSDREKYTLLEEIKDAYKRNYGLNLNLDQRETREVTSIVDPKTNPKGAPMIDTSKDPMYTPNRDTRI